MHGGLQTLYLDAGAAHAGSAYVVLGSASGTAPGLSFGPNLELALAFDAYMLATLTLANSSFLQRTVGLIDARGRASAAIVLPPAQVFADAELHHGFFVFDATGLVTATSNPQLLELLR
ncbi:MAG: hypothetical protein IPN34_10865 [Planctomycetes bacterium]|nr:hypothetical protein [Planctomycetota bacterium]